MVGCLAYIDIWVNSAKRMMMIKSIKLMKKKIINVIASFYIILYTFA